MYYKFSEVFELADSSKEPQFTACAAFLAYKEMFVHKFLTGDINYDDFKKCVKFGDYYVHQDFFDFPSDSGHCSHKSYSFILVLNLETDAQTYEMLNAVRFTTDPQDVIKKIQNCKYKFKTSKLKQKKQPKSVNE